MKQAARSSFAFVVICIFAIYYSYTFCGIFQFNSRSVSIRIDIEIALQLLYIVVAWISRVTFFRFASTNMQQLK